MEQSETEVDGNYKSQNPNNKQIPMTEIQNPNMILKKESQICLGH
jgi:hypothetical protein